MKAHYLVSPPFPRIDWRKRRISGLLLLAPLFLIANLAPAAQDEWNAYLRGPRHASFNPADSAFTPTTATKLKTNWTFTAAPATKPDQPDNAFAASPTVANGVVYIGAGTGIFYALDENSGNVLWHRSLGYTPNLSCPARGISSTAAVASDPSRGGQLTVYVGGGDGHLYALRASDGAVVWRKLVRDVGTDQNTG